ncbi:hypothetical protein AVEN_43552-1 [Araneus ventricosus]|uniref:Uncharacterized protein n=1 Tax=Araneus ventricosus TaxID=182803 RepID=A0A4Y2EL10_ARAVE|nr:hypothetical protein AVEN_43552-1 [Araneus ventricosus]
MARVSSLQEQQDLLDPSKNLEKLFSSPSKREAVACSSKDHTEKIRPSSNSGPKDPNSESDSSSLLEKLKKIILYQEIGMYRIPEILRKDTENVINSLHDQINHLQQRVNSLQSSKSVQTPVNPSAQ